MSCVQWRGDVGWDENINTTLIIFCGRQEQWCFKVGTPIDLHEINVERDYDKNCSFFKLVSLASLFLLIIQLNLFNAQNITLNDDFSSEEIVDATEKPSESVSCEKQDRPYFLAHPKNSHQFFVCVKGQSFLLNCSSDHQFDDETKQCVRKMITESRSTEFATRSSRYFEI